MERTLYKKLVEWKNSERRKPLILKGARQVGKTWLLKEFGRNGYERIAYFNFEEDPKLKDFFLGKLDPGKIIRNLSIYINWQILPKKHLIIFDEIQLSNEALNSLKYFCDEANDFHIAAAGSSLGIRLSGRKSFPVGKVNFLELYPMSFPEFLKASGEAGLKSLIDEPEGSAPYPEPLHQQFIEKLRYYYFVGGMPEAVKFFSKNGDLDEAREIQNEILNAYILDFAKYAAPKDIPKLSLIWNSIPAYLTKEQKKFVFSAISKSARAREYENAIQWLEDSMLIVRSYLLTKPEMPLIAYTERRAFKIYCLDIGLLGALLKIPPRIVVSGDKIFAEYQGAFIENYVAIQLQTLGIDFYYWTSSATAEVDFVCVHNDNIFPLEVKAGINPKSKSLKIYGQKYRPERLYRTTLLNLKKDGGIVNIPLYALCALSYFLEQSNKNGKNGVRS